VTTSRRGTGVRNGGGGDDRTSRAGEREESVAGLRWAGCRPVKGLFGLQELKFNSHRINVPSNVWSTKYRLIACMSAQIRSNLRDESIKPN
jgi:hypothetical protein